MSTNRLNWLTRTASIFIVIMFLLPMFFGGVRSVEAVSPIYVDDDWVGIEIGQDPDGAGPATSFGTDSFATIDEGVAAAVDGDAVQVYAGTYVEQVHIAQSITLIGENKLTTIIQAPALMDQDCTSPSLTNSPIICVNGGKSPTIQGFTVDGSFAAATHIRLMGIALRNAGGIIQDNIIKNICFNTDPDPQCDPNGANEGVGIYVYNTDTLIRTVTIQNNLIYDFNKNGITITTSYNSGNRTEFTISGNTIEGMVGDSGIYNSSVAQNGIQIAVPRGGGILQGNNISKIAHNNNGKLPNVGVSILTVSTPVDTKNNIITGAQAGIVYLNDREDIGNYREISGNQIEVLRPGTDANPGQNVYGILVTDRSKDILSPVDPPALNALNAVLTGAPLSVAILNNDIKYTGSLPNTKTFGIEINAGIGTIDNTGPDPIPVPGDNILSVDVSDNHIYGAPNGFDAGLVIYQCDSADLPIGTVEFCGEGYLDTSSVLSNNITGNNYGVILRGPIELSKLENFHHNRIVGNGVGVQDDTGAFIGFANNWWGCNTGPGTAGCDTLASGEIALVTPWLILSTNATPISVPAGGASIFTADLNDNNVPAFPPPGGFAWDGIPVTFSVKTLGSVNPTIDTTLLGEASTTFTAPFVGGPFEVCATVDNETVCSVVTEDAPLKIFLPLIFK